MEKIYSDEEFDTLIRASLQEDPTDYDEVTARIKTKIDDEIKRKQSGSFSRLLSCMKSNGIKKIYMCVRGGMIPLPGAFFLWGNRWQGNRVHFADEHFMQQ